VNGTLARQLGVAATLAVGLVGQAWPHAHLRTTAPPADSTIRVAPTELDLQFSEGLELAFTGVTLTASTGASVATGPARLGGSDASMLIVPVIGALAPGGYAVEWHAVSADGHKTQGRYVFSVKP
jgi:methionine-rich copper-binding protein CopC